MLQRSRMEDAEGGRQFVISLEWAVDDRDGAIAELETHALRAGAKPFGALKTACLRELSEKTSDASDEFRPRDRARLPVRVGLVHDDETHRDQLQADVWRDARNSTTAGTRISGFTLCVCPGSSRYSAPVTTCATVRAAS